VSNSSATVKTSSREKVAALAPWFHNLHLPDGTQTAPDHTLGDFPACKWRALAASVPADLSGRSVLDVGCNAGFYSFELARRGAHVTAIDVNPHYLRQAEWVAREYGLQDRVSFRRTQIYALGRESEAYDLVWFMGVFYHLRYPQLALDLLRRKTRRLMMFQTLTMPGEAVLSTPHNIGLLERELMENSGWPKMAFIEHQLANDPTNWWAPNHAAVEALLRSSGFRVLARPAHEVYWCETAEPHPLINEEMQSVFSFA
jgi:tRNA (mo5U34)-methyltransferase